jgi:hypothetical protein
MRDDAPISHSHDMPNLGIAERARRGWRLEPSDRPTA